jgi:hypothetical protein
LRVGLAVFSACALTLATMGRATTVLVLAMIASYGLWLTRPEWPSPERIFPLYTAAVLVQSAHLIEEYRGGFHRMFPPVFGADPWSSRQFLVFNLVWLAVFVIAGVSLARNQRAAYLVALFLAIGGGIANGLGHLALSARQSGYFPGSYTGALALLVGSALTYRLLQKPPGV